MTEKIAGFEVNFRKSLGRGAIGNVYMATGKDGSNIAAKQVDKTRSERSALRELGNALKLKQLLHENIVEILHIYDEEDIWIFMEFCSGGDLNNSSRKNFKELQKNKFDIMIHVSRGLAFLHSLRIAHRDIKPENILIQPVPGIRPMVAKLADFGLAKFIDPEDSTSAMETHVGTRLYMAPEFWDMNIEGQLLTTRMLTILH